MRVATPSQRDEYLATLRARSDRADLRGWWAKMSHLRVLVLGDAIRDEYHYCNTLGKAGKDPILAAQFVRAEQFEGGVQAVAAHVRACTDHVECWASSPPTVKRRFIESYPFQKLFEVYEMDEAQAARRGDALAQTVVPHLAQADVVIVADYGHGLLTPALVRVVSEAAPYLAVNVQANAGNHGFNTISKYARADLLSLSERELRLDARDQTSDVQTLALKASTLRKATVLVTRGAQGCLVVSPEGCASAPAFTDHLVDHLGAGDAVFGVAACCRAVGMPLDLLAFVASAVGAQAVGILGNSRYIEREPLLVYLEELLRDA